MLGFPNSIYQGFTTRGKAEEYLAAGPPRAPPRPVEIIDLTGDSPLPLPKRTFADISADSDHPAVKDEGDLRDLKRFMYDGAETGTIERPLPVPKPKIQLTPDQDRVLQMVLGGDNVFFTGPAGTGKSLILEHVKYHLGKLKRSYAITAPTGIAAVQLGGTTIHNFSGVGIGRLGLNAYCGMANAKHTQIGKRKDAWEKTDVLVIDEVSMVLSQSFAGIVTRMLR